MFFFFVTMKHKTNTLKYLLIFLFAFSSISYSQNLELVGLNSCGLEEPNGNINIAYSIGEIGFESKSNALVLISYGVIQPIVETNTLIPDYKVDTNIKVYPNPTSDKISINMDKEYFIHLELFDLKGKRVSQKKGLYQNLDISLRNYSSGVYFLELEHENKTTSYKIIKK